MPALAQSKSATTFEVIRTEGCRVFGEGGRSAIDFHSSWCVGNLGWTRPELERALSDFDGPAYVYPGHRYAPWEELARALIKIAPPGLERCFRATGGSEAGEIALQAAMLHTGRSRFLTIEGCYHGNTLGPNSIGDSETRSLFPRLGLPARGRSGRPWTKRGWPRWRPLKPVDIAAMILEPVICNLGALVPEPAFMRGIHHLCRRHGTLLILDEVATGFGRTGRMFAAEHNGSRPDILTLAKAITAGFALMGATLMERRDRRLNAEGRRLFDLRLASAKHGGRARQSRLVAGQWRGAPQPCRRDEPVVREATRGSPPRAGAGRRPRAGGRRRKREAGADDQGEMPDGGAARRRRGRRPHPVPGAGHR